MASPMPEAAPVTATVRLIVVRPPSPGRVGRSMAPGPPGVQARSRKKRTPLPFRRPARIRSPGRVARGAEGEGRVRIGLMVGPERGRYADKVPPARRRRGRGGAGRVHLGLGAAGPRRLRRADRRSRSMGGATSRIELGTAVVPIQTRHPVAMAQQALANQAVCDGPVHARPRPVAPLDRHRHARPAVREAGAAGAQLPRGARTPRSRAPAASTSRTTTSGCTTPST